MQPSSDQPSPWPAKASRGGAVSPGAPLPGQAEAIARTEWQPFPLPPAWILAGNPRARMLPVGNAADGDFSYCLWDCTAGEFKFLHSCDELVHILEGEVTIRTADAELHLRPGEVALFPQGATTYWTVYGYVKKLAILRSAPRGLLTRIAGKVERVWRRTLSNKSQMPAPMGDSAKMGA
jgi:uncharacterized cupin superfamily protein